jgi:predicted DNA-binding protein (MmcQ/YjbR family)
MTLAQIKKYCASLPHATADVKWGADHVYSIGGKMFAVAFQNELRGVFVSFKVDDDRFLEFTDREGFAPAPYLARAKWVQITDLKKISDVELKQLLERAYQLVALKLTKKMRREFGLVD